MESLRAALAQWFSPESLELIRDLALQWGGNILAALAIFLIGRWIAARIAKAVAIATERARVDPTLTKFLRSVVYMALLVMVAITAVLPLGVEPTVFLTIVGAAGLAIGLALKDSLSNFSSGFMLVFFRPFKVGDYVEAAGVAGNVDSISMFSTTFKTLDNRVVIVPNGMIYGSTITNFSSLGTRRIDMTVTASGADIERASSVIQAVLEADERVLKSPEPTVLLLELAGANVSLAVRPWVATDDYWTVRGDLLEEIKLALEEHGLAPPPPQQFVHLVNQT